MAARKRALQQNEAQIVVEGAEDEDQDMGEDNSEDEEGKVAMPKANGTGFEDSDDEGSIEDVMLNGHISDDESDGQGEHVGAGLSGFLDLEADESGDEEAIGDSEAEALDAASDEDESDSEDGSDSSED